MVQTSLCYCRSLNLSLCAFTSYGLPYHNDALILIQVVFHILLALEGNPLSAVMRFARTKHAIEFSTIKTTKVLINHTINRYKKESN
jgi:hypothetical protein